MRYLPSFVLVLGWVGIGATSAWAQKKDAVKFEPKDPQELVEWAIKAHGGDAKLGRTNNLTRRLFCGVDVPDVGMLPFYLDNMWVMPDKYRVRFQMPVDTRTGQWAWRETVLNGDKAWQSLNGQDKELTGSELATIKEQMYAENLCRLLPLRETRYELALINEVEFEKRTLLGMSVASKAAKPINLYFDKQTGLLTKMQYPVMGVDSRYTSQEVIFRDYKDSSGVKYWRRLSVITEGGRSFEAELVDVKFPDKIKDEYFELPKKKTDKEKDKEKK